ncbi:hypothetical protein BSKO_01228 [Bryopsis sp. KO-2023]|nr:hypothetical protein BSKO_01228 [Bryopsis sp. KO-2023]
MSSLEDMMQNWSETIKEEDGALENAVASLEDDGWIDSILNDGMDALDDSPHAAAPVDISGSRSSNLQDDIGALFGDTGCQGLLQSGSGGFQGGIDINLNNMNIREGTPQGYALRGASSWAGVPLSRREDDLDPVLVGPSLFRSNTVPAFTFGFGDALDGCKGTADQNEFAGSPPLSSCGRSSDSNSTVAREASGTKCRRGKGGSNGMSTEQLKSLDPKKVKRIMSNRALSLMKRNIQKFMMMNETLRLRLSGGHVGTSQSHQAHMYPLESRISSENLWQPTFISSEIRPSHVHPLVHTSSGVVQEPLAAQPIHPFNQHTTGCDLGNYQMGANVPPTSNGFQSAMHVDVSADNWTHNGGDAL